MRHFLTPPSPVAGLTGRMETRSPRSPLIAITGIPSRLSPLRFSTNYAAEHLPTITATA